MTKKAEQFIRRARKMLLEEFGAVETPDGVYQLRLGTKAGPLNVTFHDNGDVMTRFDFAIQGEAMVSASVPSGKWNHHSPSDGSDGLHPKSVRAPSPDLTGPVYGLDIHRALCRRRYGAALA